MLSRIKALTIKELLAMLRDRRGRIAIILPPLIQMLVFSFAATLEVKNANLGVYNQDGGKWSREVIERFVGAKTFSHVSYLHANTEITRVLDEQQVIAVVVFPADFSRQIDSGSTASVQMILDGRRTNSSQIVASYASTIVEQFNQDLRPSARPPMSLSQRAWFNPNLDDMWSTVPGLLCILTLLVALMVTSLSVAREREMGTFEQLLVSPCRAGEILVGKSAAALLIALVETSVFILLAIYGFKIPFQGSLALMYSGFVVFLLSIIGVGLFISSLATTQQQGFLGATLFMPPAVLLSGFATPIENMPDWLQLITIANPLRWVLVISRGVYLKDMPAEVVWNNTWPLLIIAAVTLTAAAWLFRKRME